MNYTVKRVGETETFSVDYTENLAPGETIVSASWAMAIIRGDDPNPSAMIVGAAAINGAAVSQSITGGVAGVTYAPKCTAITSMGQSIILPDPQDGYLPVAL